MAQNQEQWVETFQEMQTQEDTTATPMNFGKLNQAFVKSHKMWNKNEAGCTYFLD